MANTKVWLGQWQCVLQEGDPTPSTAPRNLLPSQGPLFSRAELDQLGNLGTLQIWGKFLTSAASEFTSCHWRRTTELCASVGSICPESQSTSVNTNPFQQTRSNPARLLGFLQSNCFCISQCLGNYCKNPSGRIQGRDTQEPGAITTHSLPQQKSTGQED